MTDTSSPAPAAPAPPTRCPKCGEPVAETDQFCESCGTQLGASVAPVTAETAELGTQLLPAPNAPATEAPVPARPCPSCGGVVDDDGFCTTCGMRAPSERDHFTEQPAPSVAGVCDKGIVHARNEDAMALATTDALVVLVVCDGVTNATDSDIASLAAARAAREVLVASPAPESTSPGALVEHWSRLHIGAMAAAQAEAAAIGAKLGKIPNPPSCTYVAAVLDGPILTTAWAGDSRSYWFGDDGTATQLSVDDSWATGEIAHGVPREIAEADSRAHAITRWLGVDSPGGDPSFLSMTMTGPGWVLVCSDGMWNYCSDALALRDLLGTELAAHAGDPLTTADALVRWANAQGGHDNITVALARVPGPTGAPVAGSATGEADSQPTAGAAPPTRSS